MTQLLSIPAVALMGLCFLVTPVAPTSVAPNNVEAILKTIYESRKTNGSWNKQFLERKTGIPCRSGTLKCADTKFLPYVFFYAGGSNVEHLDSFENWVNTSRIKKIQHGVIEYIHPIAVIEGTLHFKTGGALSFVEVFVFHESDAGRQLKVAADVFVVLGDNAYTETDMERMAVAMERDLEGEQYSNVRLNLLPNAMMFPPMFGLGEPPLKKLMIPILLRNGRRGQPAEIKIVAHEHPLLVYSGESADTKFLRVALLGPKLPSSQGDLVAYIATAMEAKFTGDKPPYKNAEKLVRAVKEEFNSGSGSLGPYLLDRCSTSLSATTQSLSRVEHTSTKEGTLAMMADVYGHGTFDGLAPVHVKLLSYSFPKWIAIATRELLLWSSPVQQFATFLLDLDLTTDEAGNMKIAAINVLWHESRV